MITYIVGDLFRSPTQVLVNTVNTVGVMGKGIAKQFKDIYPEMFTQYQQFCKQEMFSTGQLWLYKTNNKWILNFPTKEHWRSKSKIEYIEVGLKKFVSTYDSKGIVSISFPMLGCGNGELNWETQVQPLMEKYLKPLPIEVYIHIFPKDKNFIPEHKEIKDMKNWIRKEPRSLPFNEFWEDVIGILRRKQDFTSISNTIFSIHLDEDSQNLIINADNRDIIIKQSTLQDFWQLIRSSGFCIAKEFPAGLNQYSDFVLMLLKEISYIQLISLSRKPKITETDLGIQLIPDSEVFESPVFEAEPA